MHKTDTHPRTVVTETDELPHFTSKSFKKSGVKCHITNITNENHLYRLAGSLCLHFTVTTIHIKSPLMCIALKAVLRRAQL